MSDTFAEAAKKHEKLFSKLGNGELVYLALSEILSEMSAGKDIPHNTKLKRIVLSTELLKRAGVKTR